MKIIDAQTVQVQVEYNEPSTNPDGSALNDLAYTSTYYKIGSNPPVAAAKTTAMRPQGGGHISIPLIVPAPQGQVTRFDFWATATDTSGNESQPSAVFPFAVERIAPNAPEGFSVA